MDPTTATTDRRTDDLEPIVERRLSPMARRIAANKAAALRFGGERPMGSDGTPDATGKAA